MTIAYADGTPYNLTGKTIVMSVKTLTDKLLNDNKALITKTVTSHTTPLLGVTSIPLTITDTNILAGTYKADILIYSDLSLNPVNSQAFDFIIENRVTTAINE